MEDSGIDSGDPKPLDDNIQFSSPNKNVGIMQASRMLQRKMGSKIRNQNQDYKKSSGSLLPLQRLPIPGSKESQPLVAWDTDESDSDVVTFFPPGGTKSQLSVPVKSGPPSLQDTDAFSVEELSLTEEDDGGDDLELVLPSGPTNTNSWGCCRLL